jgi:hypothetical protein
MATFRFSALLFLFCLCALAQESAATPACVRWMRLCCEKVAERRIDPPYASRIYALLAVAQERACRQLDANGNPLQAAAIDGASRKILGTFFALDDSLSTPAPSQASGMSFLRAH